jgi:hypothetical protein
MEQTVLLLQYHIGTVQLVARVAPAMALVLPHTAVVPVRNLRNLYRTRVYHHNTEILGEVPTHRHMVQVAEAQVEPVA